MDTGRLGVRASTTRRAVHGCALALLAVAAGAAPRPSASEGTPATAFRASPRQQAFLDDLERDTFRFFWQATPAATGLTPDRTPGSDVSSVAAVGFALTSYLVGVERGYVTRSDAAARTLVTLETLWQAPQGAAAEGVSGHHGLFYHFLDARRAVRASRSELSTIDTALLMAGVLSSAAYFDRDDGTEQGPILLMVENYRTGFVWRLLRESPYLANGLGRAGFAGGWLGTLTARAAP